MTGRVVVLFSAYGGVGRTSLAIAVATAAREAGRSVVIVDASRGGDATRYVRREGLDHDVVDLSGAEISFTTRIRTVSLLRYDVDLVIVDTSVGQSETLVDRLAADGATMIGLSDASAAGIAGLLSRLTALTAAGTPRSRLGYVLNRVAPGAEAQVERIRDALVGHAEFHGPAWHGRDPLAALAPAAANIVARLRLDGRPARRAGGTP